MGLCGSNGEKGHSPSTGVITQPMMAPGISISSPPTENVQGSLMSPPKGPPEGLIL